MIRNLIKFCAKENLKLFFLPKNTNYDGNKEIKYYKENIDSNLVNFITKKSKKGIQGSKKIYSLADKFFNHCFNSFKFWFREFSKRKSFSNI